MYQHPKILITEADQKMQRYLREAAFHRSVPVYPRRAAARVIRRLAQWLEPKTSPTVPTNFGLERLSR